MHKQPPATETLTFFLGGQLTAHLLRRCAVNGTLGVAQCAPLPLRLDFIPWDNKLELRPKKRNWPHDYFLVSVNYNLMCVGCHLYICGNNVFAIMKTNVYDTDLLSNGSNYWCKGKILWPCVKIKHFGMRSAKMNLRSFTNTSRPRISKIVNTAVAMQ